MTDNYIPQTSASDRYEAARKVLADYERDGDGKPWLYDTELDDGAALALALRALITPPGTSETEEQIIDRLTPRFPDFEDSDISGIIREAVRAGIQNAHETWEPEVALRPTQEQMLRWLGIEHDETSDEPSTGILIYEQIIDREEI